jgi:uncharacterized membrane protein YgcG
MRTRPGTRLSSTSRHSSPYARHTATTKQLTADSKAWHTSATYHLLAASSPPTRKMIYIKSLEVSLAAAQEYCVSETTTRLPITPTPAFDHLTLLQTKLAEQRKQVSEVMAQNAKLMATLSKGGGGGGSSSGGGGSGGGGRGSSNGGGGGGNNGGHHRTPWKEKTLCPNCK